MTLDNAIDLFREDNSEENAANLLSVVCEYVQDEMLSEESALALIAESKAHH